MEIYNQSLHISQITKPKLFIFSNSYNFILPLFKHEPLEIRTKV